MALRLITVTSSAPATVLTTTLVDALGVDPLLSISRFPPMSKSAMKTFLANLSANTCASFAEGDKLVIG